MIYLRYHGFNNIYIAAISLGSCALPLGWLVWKCALGKCGQISVILRNRIFRYLGRISYGIYLYHLFIGYFVINALELMGAPDFFIHNGLVKLVMLSFITIAFSSFSYFFFEIHFLNMKKIVSY